MQHDDRSRWCAQHAHRQCHRDIDKTRLQSFASPDIDTKQEGRTVFSVLFEQTQAIGDSVLPRNTMRGIENVGLQRETGGGGGGGGGFGGGDSLWEGQGRGGIEDERLQQGRGGKGARKVG